MEARETGPPRWLPSPSTWGGRPRAQAGGEGGAGCRVPTSYRQCSPIHSEVSGSVSVCLCTQSVLLIQKEYLSITLITVRVHYSNCNSICLSSVKKQRICFDSITSCTQTNVPHIEFVYYTWSLKNSLYRFFVSTLVILLFSIHCYGYFSAVGVLYTKRPHLLVPSSGCP